MYTCEKVAFLPLHWALFPNINRFLCLLNYYCLFDLLLVLFHMIIMIGWKGLTLLCVWCFVLYFCLGCWGRSAAQSGREETGFNHYVLFSKEGWPLLSCRNMGKIANSHLSTCFINSPFKVFWCQATCVAPENFAWRAALPHSLSLFT